MLTDFNNSQMRTMKDNKKWNNLNLSNAQNTTEINSNRFQFVIDYQKLTIQLDTRKHLTTQKKNYGLVRARPELV